MKFTDKIAKITAEGQKAKRLGDLYTKENVDKLATEFSKVLHSWLTPQEMQKVIKENRKANDNTCATHDYCDANQALLDAIENLGWPESNAASQKDTDFLNATWDLAKRRDFKV